MIGDIAKTFHFPPSELWEMSPEEMLFWHTQAVRVNRPGDESSDA